MRTKKWTCRHSAMSLSRALTLKPRVLCAGGFTLVELMVVAVVVAILAAAIVTNLVGHTEKARVSTAQSDIAALEQALAVFYLDTGSYPTTEQGLPVLFTAPEDEEGWDGPYVTKPRFKDPWGNDYIYRSPGTRGSYPYEIVSYGKDGQEGGEGDDADSQSWVDVEAGP